MDSIYFKKRIMNHFRRRMASAFVTKTCKRKKSHAIISVSFDDFPRTAYLEGGRILRKYDFKATYYASLALMGRESPVGTIFLPDDLSNIVEDGHEIGCHTYDHLDSWITNPDIFENSIISNRKALGKAFGRGEFKTFSYPKTNPHPKIKKIASRYFECCRGGDQTYNKAKFDANLLKSYFIDKKSRENPSEIKELIDTTVREFGWLILSTHDIVECPSPFGCTPAFFEEIVRYVKKAKVSVLTIHDAFTNSCDKK